jgi:hypothetical protein
MCARCRVDDECVRGRLSPRTRSLLMVWESRESQPREPGWWLASDGRWYPPDAWPGVPAHRPRRRTSVVAAWVGAGLALVLIAIAIVVTGTRSDYSQLPKLRRASEQLTLPSTWTLVQRDEEPGAGWLCPMSCPKAEIELTFKVRGESSHSSVCATLRAAVDRNIAPTQAYRYADCGWIAPLPQAGSRAFVTAGAQPACDASGLACVFVRFSGGPRS